MQRPTTPSRALLAPAALMAAILVGATAVACDSDSTVTLPAATIYVATLSGGNEVPPRAVGGTGTATITKTSTGFDYTITYTGMSGALTGGHIHGPAAAGVNAAVIVPFANATGAPSAGTLTGSFTSTNTTTISNDSLEVLMRTGNAYVNLHTALFGGGEIRGQLSKQ